MCHPVGRRRLQVVGRGSLPGPDAESTLIRFQLPEPPYKYLQLQPPSGRAAQADTCHSPHTNLCPQETRTETREQNGNSLEGNIGEDCITRGEKSSKDIKAKRRREPIHVDAGQVHTEAMQARPVVSVTSTHTGQA